MSSMETDGISLVWAGWESSGSLKLGPGAKSHSPGSRTS